MIILSGANSMLANHVLPVIREDEQTCAFDRDNVDIEDNTKLKKLLDETDPQVFINCSGFENIEECEYKRELAYRLNGFDAGNIAKLCKERDILMVYFSSSYIFDGEKKAPYTEDDIPNPLSVYGDSLLLGEKLVKDSGCRHLIIRCGNIYGKGKSFLSDLFFKSANDEEVYLIKNLKFSPVYALDLALALKELLEKKIEGLFHFAGEGDVTLFDFFNTAINFYKTYSKKDIKFELKQLDYEEFISPIETPPYHVLSAQKIKNVIKTPFRDWKTALDDFIKNNYMGL